MGKMNIFQTTEEFGSRQFLALSKNDDVYEAVCLKSKKRYKIHSHQIAKFIGNLDFNQIQNFLEEESYDAEKCLDFCLQQMERFPSEKKYWEYLSKINPGDILILLHRKNIFKAEFVNINFKKTSYPIRAKIKGKIHDFSLNSLQHKDLC